MRKIPKMYKWKARQKGRKMWMYFSSKERAKRWAKSDGEIKRR